MRVLAVVVALGVGLCAGAVLAPKRDARVDPRVRTVVHTRTVAVVGAIHGRPAPSARAVRGPELQHLVPRDAAILTSRSLPAAGGAPAQVVATWRRTYGDTYYDDYGLNLYQLDARRHDGANAGLYHLAYALTRPGIKGREVIGIRFQLADVTGDGHDDVLVTEDHDGSAGHLVYRLIATIGGRPRELYRRSLTLDDGVVRLEHGALTIYEGVDRRPQGIHCCWRAWRRTARTWNGHALVTSSTSRSKRDPRP
jgi:hypothetical protein